MLTQIGNITMAMNEGINLKCIIAKSASLSLSLSLSVILFLKVLSYFTRYPYRFWLQYRILKWPFISAEYLEINSLAQ